MRIFVAGGTGVVGWRAVQRLVAAGHSVSVIARAPDKAALVGSLGIELQRGAVALELGVRLLAEDHYRGIGSLGEAAVGRTLRLELSAWRAARHHRCRECEASDS